LEHIYAGNSNRSFRVNLNSPALKSVIALRYAYSCSSTCSRAILFTYSCNLQMWSVTYNNKHNSPSNKTHLHLPVLWNWIQKQVPEHESVLRPMWIAVQDRKNILLAKLLSSQCGFRWKVNEIIYPIYTQRSGHVTYF
jgi:hypothetical protein